MVNRYDVPAQQATGQEYYKLPINEMLGVLAMKQKKRDDDLSKLQDLSGLADKINSLDPSIPGAEGDRALHQNIVNNVRNDVNDLYNIDVSTKEGNQELYKRINNIKRYFDPSGDAYKLNERYNKYNATLKAINDDKILEKRPDISTYAQRQVKLGDINTPDYNKTSSYNYVAPVDPKEMQEGFSNLLKDVATTTLSEGELHKYNLDPTNYLYELSNRDGRLYNTIVESASRRIPREWFNSVAQDALLSGRNPTDELDLFERDSQGQIIMDPKSKTYKLKDNELGRKLLGIGIGGQFSKLENKVGSFDDYGAKHKIDNPIANFTMTTQGLEYKPASGQNPTEYKAYQTQLGVKKQELIKPYIDKLFPGFGNNKSFDDVLALDDATLNAQGLSRSMIVRDKQAYDNLSSHENIVNQRDLNLEKQAAKELGIDYNAFQLAKQGLPEIPETGLSKNEILDAVNRQGQIRSTKNADGSISYFTKNGPISKEEAWNVTNNYKKILDNPKAKAYFDLVNKQDKILDKKDQLMKSQVTLDNTVTSKFPGNPQVSDKITESINKAVSQPYLWSELPLTSADQINDVKLNGQTLQQLVQSGTISDVNDIKVSQVGITQQPIDIDPETREPHYGIRVGISIPGKDGKMSKPYEVMLSTKNFTTPELSAEMQGPRVQASKEYVQARAEGSGKGIYDSYDFKPFNVQYNLDKGQIKIMGISFKEDDGLEKLALIKDALDHGKKIEEIKTDLPKILK